jgi:hypothetical protein
MKTEKIRITADVKSNIEVGSILVREVDAADEHRSDDYRVVYITVDGKAILVSRGQSNESAVVDLFCVNGWVKVIESIN